MGFTAVPSLVSCFSVVSPSVFATAVSADRTSSRGVVSANLPTIVIVPASVLAGQNIKENVVPSRLMAKHPMRTSGEQKHKEIVCVGKVGKGQFSESYHQTILCVCMCVCVCLCGFFFFYYL